MTDPLKLIEAQIEQKKAELTELEIAAKVIRGLALQTFTEASATNHAGESQPPSKLSHAPLGSNGGPPYTGKTMRECARLLLGKYGALHFKRIAELAIAGGYDSGRGSDKDRIAQSFWAMLSRTGDFEAAGKGQYRLKTQHQNKDFSEE